MSNNPVYQTGGLSTNDGYWSGYDGNPNSGFWSARSYYRRNGEKPALLDYGFTALNSQIGMYPTNKSGFISDFYPKNMGTYTLTLTTAGKNKIKDWMHNSSKFVYLTTGDFTGSLPKPNGANVVDYLVASRNNVTTKTYIRFEAYNRNSQSSSSHCADCASNPVIRYGTDELPERKAQFMIWFNPYKSNNEEYLYDVYSSLMCCQSKHLNTLYDNSISNMTDFIRQGGVTPNYTYSDVAANSLTLHNTWRILTVDFSTSRITVTNAVSITPAQVTMVQAYHQSPRYYYLVSTIIETFSYPVISNYQNDQFSVDEFTVNYDVPDTFIPATTDNRIEYANNALYGIGRSFFNPGGVDSIPLSNSPGTYNLHLRRKGNSVYVSYKGLSTVIPYSSSIQIRILSRVSAGVYKGFTVNNLTEGFEHDIQITETQVPVSIYDTGEYHTALIDSIKNKTTTQWIFEMGAVSVSGLFNTYYHNNSLNIVASDIIVNYFGISKSAINFSFDVIMQDATMNKILVKTGFASDYLSESSTDTITFDGSLSNGINLTLPIYANEYVNGSFVGRQSLAVNQNSFGVSLQYDDVDDSVVATDANPYFNKYFGGNYENN